MILKAKERGNGKQLATYLLTVGENEHVALHDLRGFASDNLRSAFQEIDAVAKGTRAKNSMFSMSLNPPSQERVSTQDFEAAIDAIEEKLGLEGQPRAVVFHEKDGRRHAHVVWSRINAEAMKAINLAHYKLKLTDLSRELFIEHGWELPKGLIRSKERDPKNFSLQEYQQAKRANVDPKALKAMFQECWASSDNARAFSQALQARGYHLARGDRRGIVAMDFKGEVFAVAKWIGRKAKEVRARLGEGENLPTVEQVRDQVSVRMTETLRRHIASLERKHGDQKARLEAQRIQMVERQRKERRSLDKSHSARWQHESGTRSARLNKGLRGLWDRVTGEHKKTVRQNEREALEAMRRDRFEKDGLIERQLDERRDLHRELKMLNITHQQDVQHLHVEIASYTQSRGVDRENTDQTKARSNIRERTSAPPKGPSRER